ncbi:MAG: hypothetical protein IPK75_20395 [Acidobacteria bacterium]|nr:hypothetical protein [Acidobacteriota bacterium]
MTHTLVVRYGHVINEMAEAEMERRLDRAPDRVQSREANALRLVEWDFPSDGEAAAALAKMPQVPGFTYIVGDSEILPPAPAALEAPPDESAALAETVAEVAAPVDLSSVGGALPLVKVPMGN